jgi:phage tail-like protein
MAGFSVTPLKYDPYRKDFMAWMQKVNKFQSASGTSEESVHDFRKDIMIEMYDLANDKVLTVNVYRAWPSKLTVADFDAKANELAIEVLELQHEGWDVTDHPGMVAEERK